MRRRLSAVPAVAASATTVAMTGVLLAPAAAAGTVPVVDTTCPDMVTVAEFQPGNAVSGNATVSSKDGADHEGEGEGLFLIEQGTSRPFTQAVHLGGKSDVSQIFSFTATGTSLAACLLQTDAGDDEEDIGTVWANVTK